MKYLAYPLAFLVTLIFLLCSCGKTQYVAVETVKTDSIYISLLQKDSIYIQDSIFVREKNDTVYVDKVKYRYKEKILTDTVYSERVDTIRVPYPVERKLSKWEETYLAVGRISLWVIVVVIFIIVGSMVYKLYK